MTIDAVTGDFSWTPTEAQGGLTPSVTVTVTDNGTGNLIDSETFTVTVTDINEAPSAVDDSVSGNEDTVIVGNVLSNDSDVDGDTPTASLVSGPANGSLALNADGSYSYTPDANWSGTDSFTYTANDGALYSNVATVTITVNPVDDTDPGDGVLTTNDSELFENPETDDGLDPGVEVPAYEDPVIEDEQAPPVEENLTPQDSSDADDQLVHMVDAEIEETEEIILLTDEIDTGSQSEGRDDDRSVNYFDNDLYKDMHLSKYLDFNYKAAENKPLESSGDDFSLLDINSDDPNIVDVNGDYDLLREEIDESFDTELNSQSVRAKIVTVATASFTVGIVSYLLRAGSLVASLMSSLPLWRGFDPIAIYSGEKKKKKDRKKTPDTDELKSETLFDGEEK
jgi:VCBS repeat-containing protein